MTVKRSKELKNKCLNNDVVDEHLVYEIHDKVAANCIHECIRPTIYHRPLDSPIINEKYSFPPARTFTYKLDAFQSKAIRCLEAGESVLVAAHTSAGKTTVAEYAIAMGLRDKQRVIYTSPIKALSNQKYRDFSESFDDVGLITGDVSINPNASILIMTTEILRHMLYRGSSVVREMKWCIFDEIHYMRDKDRGVIWEETIILLPDSVRLVFLSATIPNALEFAGWICSIKHQPCHILLTDSRPTPLQHFMFPKGSDGIHLVLDENHVFKEKNFHQAIASLQTTVDNQQMSTKKKKHNKADIEKIILLCQQKNYIPLIVFSFSKRDVENNATSMKTIDLTDSEEKSLIGEIFRNAIATLSDDDQNLPQIKYIIPLLSRGIGIHHGGLLPIIKEVIEILFQETLIKVLFSTETFSMGVNMPAKTVVFTEIRKWDGNDYRLVSAGEYIQMSGRAGRRGIDERGLTIIMFDERLEPEDVKNVFLGDPLKIDSKFYLSYNMILNLLRVEGAAPDYIIKRSFLQYQKERLAVRLIAKKKQLEIDLVEYNDIGNLVQKEIPNIKFHNCATINDDIADYYLLKNEVSLLKDRIRQYVMSQLDKVGKFLSPGRIVHIVHDKDDYGLAVVYKVMHKKNHKHAPKLVSKYSEHNGFEYLVEMFVFCNVKDNIVTPDLRYFNNCRIVALTLDCINHISKAKLAVEFNRDFHNPAALEYIGLNLLKAEGNCQGNLPMLDIQEHILQTNDETYEKYLKQLIEFQEILDALPLNSHKHLPLLIEKFEKKVNIQSELHAVTTEMQERELKTLLNELKNMQYLLKEYQCLDEDDVITLKGRVACEITAGNELIISDLLFHNIFETYEIEYIVAILSCLCFEEQRDTVPPTNPKLVEGYKLIISIASRIADLSEKHNLTLNREEFLERFQPGLMEFTLGWMRGDKFGNLLKNHRLYEGSVVRAIRNLEELLRQLASASKNIGNESLEDKFVQGIKKLKRGIIFAASLYL